VAYSQVGVCNLALFELGVPAISAMTEDSDAAILMNAIWEYARNEVLEDGDWHFSKSISELTADAVYAAAPTNPLYDYRYSKPASCIKIMQLVDENGADVTEYVLEGDYIYVNFDNTGNSLYCRYTVVVTDVTKWSAKFIRALKYKLAGMASWKLTRRDSEAFEQKYVMALNDAMGLNQAQDYIESEKGNTDWTDRT